jgi:cytochrome c biogenesis factor
MGAWGTVLGFSGALTGRADLSASGERGVHAATVFAAVSLAGLAWALAVGDLTYRYVATWTSYGTPLPYRIGAMWAGPSGALLLWAVALGLGASLASATLRRGSVLRAWTTALLALLLLAVLAMACFDTNPFLRLPFPPDDGRGLALEWLRPVVLAQVPLGDVAMALVAVPAVLAVMGAMGKAPWRAATQRWALACWGLLAAAMLLDWRRRYGDTAWADDWRWAPVHAGTAFAWAGASLLVLISGRRWRADASILVGFAGFTLALVGLTLQRAHGWEGVHEFAASASGRALAWLALAAVTALAVDGLRALRGTAGVAALALRVTHGATLVAAAALLAAGFVRGSDVAVQEGERVVTADRFGTAWTLSLEGVSTVGRVNVVSNVVAVRGAVQGRARAYVTAEVRSLFTGASSAPADQLQLAGIAAGLVQDLRVDVREANTADAILTVRFVPAASWLWIAGALAVLGALVAALAPARRDPEEPAGVPATPEAPRAPDAAGAETPAAVAEVT